MKPCELNPTFCRRLLLSYWIDTLERPNIGTLIEHCGWPRRTLQDIIKALPGLGIEVEFVEDGVRHNDGYYRITSWGPIQRDWIEPHLKQLQQATR